LQVFDVHALRSVTSYKGSSKMTQGSCLIYDKQNGAYTYTFLSICTQKNIYREEISNQYDDDKTRKLRIWNF